jgi:hypothetical protein
MPLRDTTSACWSPRPAPARPSSPALIATHAVSTLVLVDRDNPGGQWRTRISELLGINAGQRGGGRSKTTGVVDVATLQTLARAEDVADLAAGYGLAVVDECHHVPAAAFTSAATQIPTRRWSPPPLPARPAGRPHRPATGPDPPHPSSLDRRAR